jgi:hypothetical protein
MRWLFFAALLSSCKTERVAPSLPPTEAVEVRDLAFWRWFSAHAAEVATVKDGREPISDQLAAELHKIEDGLVFELGLGKSGPHELIVSADGRKALFPTVQRVVVAAPSIPGWRAIAFRPRKGAGRSIEIGDTKLGPDGVWFQLLPTAIKPGPIDLAIYAPGVGGADEGAVKSAAFVLLDALLGEYDVGIKLGEIQFQPAAKKPAGARPLKDLPATVDGWK